MSFFGNVLRSITGGKKKSSPFPLQSFKPVGSSPLLLNTTPSLLSTDDIHKVMEKKPVSVDSIVNTIGNIADAGTKVFTAINTSKGNYAPASVINPNTMTGSINDQGLIQLPEVVITPNDDLLSNAKNKLNSILRGDPVATVGTELSISSDTKSLIFVVLGLLGAIIIIPKLIKK